MQFKEVSGAALTLLLVGTLALAFNLQPVKADWTCTETIYIKADGSVTPDTAPISSVDNITYVLTDNIIVSPSVGEAVVVERDNIVVDGAGYTLHGQEHIGFGICLSRRSNVTIKNMAVTEFLYGGDIIVEDSANITISGNHVTNSQGGIFVEHSANITISGNHVTSNTWGIYLVYSASSTIEENRIAENSQFGIWLQGSPWHSVIGNNITENGRGIQFSSSRGNTVSGNYVASNGYGIYLLDSASNEFCHNNIVANGQQVYVYYSGNASVWDGGYPSGGNYWSEYSDVDLCCGPDQDMWGRDGIWDHPYVIDANNTDTYPLVNRCISGRPAVSVATDKYTYHVGDRMHVGLNASNPDSVKHVCFAIWAELPDSSVHLYWHEHSVLLPIGTTYSDPSFVTMVLPSIPSGTYTWHAAFLDRATHTILVEDTAEWQFS